MRAIEQSLKRALQELGPTLFSSVSVAATLTATLAARLSPWPLCSLCGDYDDACVCKAVRAYLLTVMSCVSRCVSIYFLYSLPSNVIARILVTRVKI